MNQIMTTQMQGLKLVANLQTIVRPYVALYIDKEHHSLYVIIKSSINVDNRPAYLVVPVTKYETIDYLNRKVRLRNLFAHKSYTVATIDDGHGLCPVENKSITKSTVKSTGKLDPEFCSNKFKILYYVENLPET